MVERSAVPASAAALEAQVGNLLVNRAGKHRRRAAIKVVHYDPLHARANTPSFFDAVAARSRLRELEAASRPADWSLLVRVGMGGGMAEIAIALGSTETAVKKRVARARERIAA
jgi:DNA-directed RNA polymerase specialized sigma24 family protein